MRWCFQLQQQWFAWNKQKNHFDKKKKKKEQKEKRVWPAGLSGSYLGKTGQCAQARFRGILFTECLDRTDQSNWVAIEKPLRPKRVMSSSTDQQRLQQGTQCKDAPVPAYWLPVWQVTCRKCRAKNSTWLLAFKLKGTPLERSTDHFGGKWCNFNHIGLVQRASCSAAASRGVVTLFLFTVGVLGGLSWGHSEALERAAWLKREHSKYWQAVLETGLGVQRSYWAIVTHHTG